MGMTVAATKPRSKRSADAAIRASTVAGPWVRPPRARTIGPRVDPSANASVDLPDDSVDVSADSFAESTPSKSDDLSRESLAYEFAGLFEYPSGDRVAKPFVKWAGGKRKLVPYLLRFLPERFGNYFEPFVGGGALFYALLPTHAFLSDENERLVRAYRGVRDDVEGVIQLLRSFPHSHDFFMRKRRENVDAGDDVDVAAWFIYLNKTGFNGLYRVNRRNEFNVPFGDLESPTICDETNLRACSKVLRRAKLDQEDFAAVLTKTSPGDLVYFDPPYIPLSVSSSFVNYTKGGFGIEDHRRLRDTALVLKQRGVHVLVSNSAHPLVRELYETHFVIDEVFAPRAINCCGDRRGKIRELIIH